MWAVLNAVKTVSKQLQSDVPGGKDLSRKPSQVKGNTLRISKRRTTMTKINISIVTAKRNSSRTAVLANTNNFSEVEAFSASFKAFSSGNPAATADCSANQLLLWRICYQIDVEATSAGDE